VIVRAHTSTELEEVWAPEQGLEVQSFDVQLPDAQACDSKPNTEATKQRVIEINSSFFRSTTHSLKAKIGHLKLG
jgi:hypothetical protein